MTLVPAEHHASIKLPDPVMLGRVTVLGPPKLEKPARLKKTSVLLSVTVPVPRKLTAPVPTPLPT